MLSPQYPPPENPEKNALFESRAAECGAVAFDAAIEPEIDPELCLVVEAWSSLNGEIREALLTIVRACLEKQSDASNLPENDS
jgi:hypothetical protein